MTSDLGSGRYQVETYVDAENSFWALVRTQFTCLVEYQDDGSDRLVSLEFVDE